MSHNPSAVVSASISKLLDASMLACAAMSRWSSDWGLSKKLRCKGAGVTMVGVGGGDTCVDGMKGLLGSRGCVVA